MLLFARDPALIDARTRYLTVAARIQCAYVFDMMDGTTLPGIGEPIGSFAVTVGRSLIRPSPC
jgi:hypothetical protein